MKTYATITDLKARLDIDDSTDDAMLDAVLVAASREIDLFCGRRFYRADETRYYTPEDGDMLRVDDLVSVATLKSDDDGDRVYETTWGTDDYDLCPDNAALDNWPYTQIEVAPSGSYAFPTGRKSVQLAGVFGWPSIPEPVHVACLVLAAWAWKRKDAIFGVLGSIETGMIRLASLDPDTQAKLMLYRKLGAGGV
jgi:hypothetical protein